ncbi:hypothetical protein NDU88_002909 [Pleurodeles waltl]|uniref:Uncharacterized protein n=1 Tax=Pleurodeles waltl TaxID=8319 RepID=A0AAV7TM00_PLEWA|nr:hypothetical protein NDU88_002909 [Pleurodeles waltl]
MIEVDLPLLKVALAAPSDFERPLTKRRTLFIKDQFGGRHHGSFPKRRGTGAPTQAPGDSDLGTEPAAEVSDRASLPPGGGEVLCPARVRAQPARGCGTAEGLQVQVTPLETGPCLFYCGENQRHRGERSGSGAPRLSRLRVVDTVNGVCGAQPELEGGALTEEAP